MRLTHFLIAVLLFCTSVLSAQSEYISNPSFEGRPGQGYSPPGWIYCNSISTPDTQPYDTGIPPTDGFSYLGLVMRNLIEPKNEDVGTLLLKPLKKDSTYYLSVDLAINPQMFDYFPEGDIYYDQNPRLRISGGTDICSIQEVFVVSELITNSTWIRYAFEITPKISDCYYLKLEIFLENRENAYLLLDNIKLDKNKIEGSRHVCVGEKNIVYKLNTPVCATNLNWKYTGEGAIVKGSLDSIVLDFDNNATSGNLLVTFDNCGKGLDSVIFPISIDTPLLMNAGSIFGLNEVCQGQNRVTFQAKINNSSLYRWNYTGTGAIINGNSDSINIDFTMDATSGILKLTTNNACNIDSSTPNFPITVKKLPDNAGEIFGNKEVCQNDKGVNFQISAINASEYIWTFNGSGVTITGNTNKIGIDFSKYATGGTLKVSGKNECGTGNPEGIFIYVKPLPSVAGSINGEHKVCKNQNSIIFNTSLINNATEYLWNYTGSGVNITGNLNKVNIDFSNDATEGILTVTGKNECGTGNISSEFPVSIEEKPPAAGIINGDNSVCMDRNLTYSITPVNNALIYHWSYSGAGNLTENNENVNILFSGIETAAVLTVSTSNICGTGEPSPPFYIVVNDCNLNIPNSFSPNEDGINDTFIIRNLIENSSLTIFDRLGKIVYKSENYQNDWNGDDIHDTKLPSDTYWYVFSSNGTKPEIKGFIYLKR